MDIIHKYFPDLSDDKIDQIKMLKPLYEEWNSKINVISRKDIEELYLRHILHSLSIAKIINFKPGTKILDVGTGGGLPGIPLAILFPETKFHLVDSIGKKIKVVTAVSEALGLKNVTPENIRAEKSKLKYDFVISRAVTAMEKFVPLVRKKIAPNNINSLKNGIIALKGGLLVEELDRYKKDISVYDISDFFEEDFFETKKVIHLPL